MKTEDKAFSIKMVDEMNKFLRDQAGGRPDTFFFSPSTVKRSQKDFGIPEKHIQITGVKL